MKGPRQFAVRFCGLSAYLMGLGACQPHSFQLIQVTPQYVVHDAVPYVVQPDYNKWRQVTPGMNEEAVERILGCPVWKGNRPSVEDEQAGMCYLWHYGEIDFKSYTVPGPCSFELLFKQGKVADRFDPFGGDLSLDGKPTLPKPISPLPGSVFSHFPRYLDLRWKLSSGNYPMTYEIDIQTAMGEEWDSRIVRVNEPYYPYAHVGKGNGRWRVRAMNSLGESGWTEWFRFSFDN